MMFHPAFADVHASAAALVQACRATQAAKPPKAPKAKSVHKAAATGRKPVGKAKSAALMAALRKRAGGLDSFADAVGKRFKRCRSDRLGERV